MSKNSKQARKLSRAREMAKIRKGGGKGASKTVRLHTKNRTWYNPNSPTFFRKGGSKKGQSVLEE